MHDYRYGRGSAADEAVRVVSDSYEAFGRRDLGGVLATAAEDIVLGLGGTASRIGRSEPYRGHEGIRQYFADAQRTWKELVLSADDIRATGGGVVVFGHVEAATEEGRIRRRVIWTWQVRDGLVVSVRVSDMGDAPAA